MIRFLLAVLLGLGLFPASAAEVALMPLDDDNVVVDYQDGLYAANLSFLVAVAPAVALEVLTDFDHMADFVPNLASSRVVARTGNVYRIAQEGKANFGPFSFRFSSERRIELFPDGRLVAQALSGSTRYMRSELRIRAGNGGTRLDYRIEMIPDQWIPSTLGVSFMRHELAEQFTALGREMERRQKVRSAR